MNVLNALNHHAQMRPNDPAILHSRGALSFFQLRNAVYGVSARLRDAAFDRTRPVGIYVADPVLHAVLILGLAREALASFSGHPNYDAAPPGANIGTYLCDRTMPHMDGATVIAADESWLAPPAGASAPGRRAFAGPDALARIIASSGTTGLPKAVGVSFALVEKRIAVPLAIGEFRVYPTLSLITLSGVVGFRHFMTSLQLGQPQVLVGPTLHPLNAIRLYNVRSLTGSPAQLLEIAEAADRAAMRFPSLEEVRVMGSTLAPASATRLRTILCPNLIGRYGSSEAGSVADAPAELLERIPGCAGYVSPWAQIEIVDDNDRPVPAETEGAVRIRSLVAVDRYLGDDDAQERAFRNGWFYPGDLGALTAEGVLRITGRTVEVINAGGVKVNPDLISNFLLGREGILEAAAFGVDPPGRVTEIWAAVVSATPIDEGALIEACRQALNSRAPRRIVQLDRLPRNTMGKVVTRELQRVVGAA